jgi:uncharacterized protein with FMN-binding domain
MATKMPRRLVALSASAIAAVYLGGYITTQGADSGLAVSASAPVAALTATATPTSVSTPFTITQAAPAVPTTAPSTGTAYQDGTYQGQGTSRRGGFRVAVTIQGGTIANVAITQVTTQYPVSRIAALPGQVVARQSAQVDRVTGATYSTQAFQQAVQQALATAGTSQPSASATTSNGQGA